MLERRETKVHPDGLAESAPQERKVPAAPRPRQSGPSQPPWGLPKRVRPVLLLQPQGEEGVRMRGGLGAGVASQGAECAARPETARPGSGAQHRPSFGSSSASSATWGHSGVLHAHVQLGGCARNSEGVPNVTEAREQIRRRVISARGA